MVRKLMQECHAKKRFGPEAGVCGALNKCLDAGKIECQYVCRVGISVLVGLAKGRQSQVENPRAKCDRAVVPNSGSVGRSPAIGTGWSVLSLSLPPEAVLCISRLCGIIVCAQYRFKVSV